MKKIVGIIPARFESSRFPGKPLIDINGVSMIQRIFEQSKKVKQFSNVIIATDDLRIFNHVKEFGGEVVMTSSLHQSGTDRCAEVVNQLVGGNIDIAVNIQGDEPFINPIQIEQLISCFQDEDVKIATLIKKTTILSEITNPNVVKVIIDSLKNAIYFSRQAIPYKRNVNQNKWNEHVDYYKHIGIYAYTTDTLCNITKLKQSKLELAESLEQLRWLENGYKIKTALTELENIAIDTPEDLEKIKRL